MVEGDVDSVGSLFTDVYDSFIDGDLTVTANEVGAVFCGSALDGDATYADNSDVVQLGADDPVASVGPANTGRGDINGDHEDWDGVAAAAAAVASADEAGKAQL